MNFSIYQGWSQQFDENHSIASLLKTVIFLGIHSQHTRKMRLENKITYFVSFSFFPKLSQSLLLLIVLDKNPAGNEQISVYVSKIFSRLLEKSQNSPDYGGNWRWIWFVFFKGPEPSWKNNCKFRGEAHVVNLCRF